jgi:hypothetical protein
VRQIGISESSYIAIDLAAKLAGTTHAQVVTDLLARVASPSIPASANDPDGDQVAIARDYKGHRTKGILFPSTGRVTISSGPLSGRSFATPSGAGKAVIIHHSGNQKATCDGWRFWLLDDGTQRQINEIRPAA